MPTVWSEPTQPAYHARTVQCRPALSPSFARAGYQPRTSCHSSHPPARQPVQCVEQVLCRAPPATEFGDEDRIDVVCLRKLHDLGACRAIGLHARSDFAESLDTLIPPSRCETGQIAQPPLARLVHGRDAGVDGGTLSQLNLPEIGPRKPLICTGSVLSKTDFCPTGTPDYAETPYPERPAAVGVARPAKRRGITSAALCPARRHPDPYRPATPAREPDRLRAATLCVAADHIVMLDALARRHRS